MTTSIENQGIGYKPYHLCKEKVIVRVFLLGDDTLTVLTCGLAHLTSISSLLRLKINCYIGFMREFASFQTILPGQKRSNFREGSPSLFCSAHFSDRENTFETRSRKIGHGFLVFSSTTHSSASSDV